MVGISRYTVAEYLRRAGVVGITWPVPAVLDDVALERKLFTPPFGLPEPLRPQPDWQRVACRTAPAWRHPDRWCGRSIGLGNRRGMATAGSATCTPPGAVVCRRPCARLIPAGERMFVDYAGQTAEVIDGATGEVRRAQIFVAALGASNLTYAEARWTQALPDWIGCHVGAFAGFGGVARQIVCDNLKAGVTAASRYEPGISRTYQDMATHYGTAILPARVRKPARQGQGRGRRPGGAALGAGADCGTGGSSPWRS